MSNKKDPVEERLDKITKAFDFLWWDYHAKFHKSEGDNSGGHHACVEWPCVYIADALRK